MATIHPRARRRLELAAITVFCAGLTVYDGARARLLSITHDESLTYFLHVLGRVRDIVLFHTPGLPDNNHVLFTLLAKLSVHVFGNSELALRLPSVLACGLFCTAAAAILARQGRGALLLLGLPFVAANPYVIDMMTIARGYGLGIALSLAATWCLLRDSEMGQPRPALWACAAGLGFGLAVLANLSFLLVAVVGFGVMVLTRAEAWWRGRTTLARAAAGLAGPLLLAAALVPFLANQIRILGRSGLLNTEGLTSFDVNTVRGVLDGTLYFTTVGAVGVGVLVALAYAIPLVGMLAGAAAWFRPAAGEGARGGRDLLILSLVLTGAAVLSVVQHHLLHVAYLSDRRAAFLYPLFALVWCGIVAAGWGGRAAWQRGACRVLAVLQLAFVVHFAQATNLRLTRDWAYDSETKAMMAEVATLLPRTGPQRFRFGLSWEFGPAINYYLYRNGWSSVTPVDRDDPLGPYDAYYVFDTVLPALRRTVPGLTVVRHYDQPQATLLRPGPAPP